MTTTLTSPTTSARTTLAALWTGLALTVFATVYPFVDRMTGQRLAAHIGHGYPDYSPGQIASAVSTYLVILSVIGVLAVIGWLVIIRATTTGRHWTRWVAPVIFLIALTIAISALTIPDTSGEVGLAPVLGWLQLLPCIPGLIAVILLWRRR